MLLVPINLVGALLATIVSMLIGIAWFSPFGFGPLWIRLSGVKMDQGKSPPVAMLVAVLCNFVTACVIAEVLAWAHADTARMEMLATFWLWLGFIAAVKLMHFMFDGRSLTLWLFYAVYDLVNVLLMAIVLVLWK
ncbi:DUF1761 domain-containing protein [Candidatus Peregrinibacteria bacterium]|nr:DUF1761 domain-containing protein [Candidatus Peregrinibacteria bacterium]